MPNYAIFTWSEDGPIKTWQRMRLVQAHNCRERDEPHCDPHGPAPEHLVGSGDLVGDARARLAEHGVNPDNIRRGGVIAYEAVITASREFFEEGTAAERRQRLVEWAEAQVDFVFDRFGEHRIVSLVLHLDELTPHIHLVVLPLDRKIDGRRSDSKERWSLVGRTISGPGMYQDLQDSYAAAMSRFGLERGVEGSGGKKRPVTEYLKELAAKEEAADQAKKLAEQEADHQRRLSEFRVEQLALVARDREEATKDRAAASAARKTAEREMAEARSQRLAAERDAQQLDALFGALNRTLERALRVREAFAGIPAEMIPPSVRQALQELTGFQQSAATVRLPHVDRPTVQQQAFEQRRLSVGRQ